MVIEKQGHFTQTSSSDGDGELEEKKQIKIGPSLSLPELNFKDFFCRSCSRNRLLIKSVTALHCYELTRLCRKCLTF